MSQELDAAKLGARNSRSDKQRIRDMRKAARSIHDTTLEMEPDDEDAPAKADLDIEGDEQPVITGIVRAVKAEGDEWALDVLGVPFGGHNGGKDSDGEWFDAETKTHEDKYGLPPAVYYHGHDENGKPSGQPIYIGKTVSREKRADGWWFRVVLNKASQYAKRVWEAAQQGIAKASSGSISHLVRKERTGRIAEWPVAELSIFDTGGKRQPANQYAVALPAAKAIYQEAGLPFPEDIPASQPEADARGVLASTQRADAAQGANTQTNNRSGVLSMDENQVNELVAKAVTNALKAQQEAADAAAERQKEIDDAVAAAVKEATDKAAAEVAAAKAEAAEARRLPFSGDIPYVAKFGNLRPYDGVSEAGLAVAIGVLKAARVVNRSEGPSENLYKALAVRVANLKDEDNQWGTVKAQMEYDFQGKVALKANELNQSTLANFGDEWVSEAWSRQMWERIRLATTIVAQIPTTEIPQGADHVVIPLEAAAPTFYMVAQASAQDSNPGRVTPTFQTSKQGTANQTITANKMGAAVNWSQELEEDSIVRWADSLRMSLTKEGAEVLEHVVIDGDTATGATTNINHIGGTPGARDVFLLFNGFRKLALVTNTANSRDAGTLDVDDYLETVKLLGVAGIHGIDREAIMLIPDVPTYWKTLALEKVSNRDHMSNPVLDGGELIRLWGYRLHPSANMHRVNGDATYGRKANDAGKVDQTTVANNTKGSILAVRRDQWMIGWKRRQTFEVARDPISDSTVIVVHMRLGMINRDTEAAAISYNVGL